MSPKYTEITTTTSITWGNIRMENTRITKPSIRTWITSGWVFKIDNSSTIEQLKGRAPSMIAFSISLRIKKATTTWNKSYEWRSTSTLWEILLIHLKNKWKRSHHKPWLEEQRDREYCFLKIQEADSEGHLNTTNWCKHLHKWVYLWQLICWRSRQLMSLISNRRCRHSRGPPKICMDKCTTCRHRSSWST